MTNNHLSECITRAGGLQPSCKSVPQGMKRKFACLPFATTPLAILSRFCFRSCNYQSSWGKDFIVKLCADCSGVIAAAFGNTYASCRSLDGNVTKKSNSGFAIKNDNRFPVLLVTKEMHFFSRSTCCQVKPATSPSLCPV